MQKVVTQQPAERIHHLLEQQAARQPQAVLLYEEGGTVVSYEDMWRAVLLSRDWLVACGVRAGDRVMVVGENGKEMVQALFACSLLGAWMVGLNPRLSAREVTTIRDHAQPALSLYLSGMSTASAEHAASLECQEAAPTLWGAGNLWRSHRDTAEPEAGPEADAVATLIYTSGTTGAPKAVMVPHRGLVHFARISAESRRLSADDISYAALPLSHIFGIATVLLASVYAGASLVVRRRFDPNDVLQALVHPGLTMLQGVPTMFTRLLEVCTTPTEAPRLRCLYAGGSALDPTLKQRVEALFGLPMQHGYGITEYAGSMFITPLDTPRADCSAGYAVEGVELHIGELEQPMLPTNESGPIYIRGPGVMVGYYRDPEQTAATLLPGGWLCTGDLGRVDAEGALFITGRTKDMIIRSGFNVYPLEVEAIINTYPGIKLSAVVGHTIDDGNEDVIAFYEPMEDAAIDTEKLMQHLRAQLAPYKIPIRILELQTIPTTVSGKIKKQPLRELLG